MIKKAVIYKKDMERITELVSAFLFLSYETWQKNISKFRFSADNISERKLS